MEEFIRHFVREHDGAWQCVSPGILETPSGRIQVTPGSRFAPGTIIMGVEIAAWLDYAVGVAMQKDGRKATR